MDIAAIGEFGLIDQLTKTIKLRNDSSLYGVGDDCAVIAQSSDKQTLITTDLLLEGIHFDLTYCPLKHLGYKAAIVNISDIVAMNGFPKQMTISIGMDKRFTVEMVKELYAGIYAATEAYGVDIVGGDTSSSLTGLIISITCIGEVEPQKVVYRNGAKPTNLLCVSGNLGAAYVGLQILEREKRVFLGHEEDLKYVQPDFAGKEYVLERQLRPEARLDIINALRTKGIKPTAMMDISDGLSSEALHIAKQSHVGIRIYENRIPIDATTATWAEEMNLSPLTVALNGGEDYELLFSVPIEWHEDIKEIPDVRIIGHTTEENLGSKLILSDGTEIDLIAQGWQAMCDK